MSNLYHYIDFLDGNGFQQVKQPQEWKSLNVELNFMQDQSRISSDSFEIVGDDAVSINTYVDGGGITEGLPYKIILDCEGTPYTILEATLMVGDEGAEYFCDMVKIPVREMGNIDYLTERADSFRFAYLAKGVSTTTAGYISPADYIDIWYVQGTYPDNEKIIIASITLFLVLKELYESIKRIADVAAAIAGGATGIAESVLMGVALVIYLGILFTALIDLIGKLIAYIFPFVYYHRGMYERTLWEKACAYLGLSYSSSIHTPLSPRYNDYLMPPKNTIGAKVGQPLNEEGYYEGTFSEFISGQIEKYNGEVKIKNGVLYFEPVGTFQLSSTYRIPEVEYDAITTNFSEVPSNYVVEYTYDGIDLYDYDVSSSRFCQVTTEPSTYINKKNIQLKNYVKRVIPYSMVNVKTSTSVLEVTMTSIYNAFSSLVNAVAGLIGSSSLPLATIPPGGSINVIKLESHFTGIHKNGIYLGGGKTSPSSVSNALGGMGATKLFETYHANQIAKPIYNQTGNQWKRIRGYKVDMCCDDYLAIKNNNYAEYKGLPARLLSVKWNPYMQTAEIDFEYNEIYTTNLKVTIISPDFTTTI